MRFGPRVAALATAVAVPLGAAAASYILTDGPSGPAAPPIRVQIGEARQLGPAPPPASAPTADNRSQRRSTSGSDDSGFDDDSGSNGDDDGWDGDDGNRDAHDGDDGGGDG